MLTSPAHLPLSVPPQIRSANQSPLSLLVQMELGQASPVCLGQGAKATAVLGVPLVQQPGLKDAWSESQWKTQPG